MRLSLYLTNILSSLLLKLSLKSPDEKPHDSSLTAASLLRGPGPKKNGADRCSKNIFLAKPMENRPRGRLPLRWINCIEKDLKTLKGQKTGKQLPKVEMDGENFWRRPESIQGCRTFEEENLPHPSTTATN
ncbi:hypothetical protein TNCV_138981 [Trichonephila clavipes]|nr:hypothetical protein TNCV_138981 [Trichonephila clavipes]